MSGLGGWSFGYYQQDMAVPNDRVAAGIHAFKQALIDNGFATGINLAARGFGHSMSKQTKAFQKAKGLQVDGVIGPDTAHHLFRIYAWGQEAALHIPNHYTAKQAHLESDDDPVAQGYADEEDEGECQLHMPYYPGITLAQAWDPKFSLAKLAAEQASFYHKTPDWDGAIAAWNIGTGSAKTWVAAGKPATLVITLEDGTKLDIGVRATHYVALVKEQPA